MPVSWHSVRAVMVDAGHRVLLLRFDLPDQGLVVWAPPGGGVEEGETPHQALRRELDEELGYALDGEPPLIWQQHLEAWHADYYLVETDQFEPGASLGADALRAENVTGYRWWTIDEVRDSDEVFGPRQLGALLADLVTNGVPARPHEVGL